jgi:hypothetical protein
MLPGCFVGASLLADLFTIAALHAEPMFTWHDADGVRQYSDTCPAAQECELRQIGASKQGAGNSSLPRQAAAVEPDTGSATVVLVPSSSSAGDGSSDADAQAKPGNSTSSGTNYAGQSDAVKGGGIGLLVEWTEPAEANVAGYRVYYARIGSPLQPKGQGVNVGKATQFLLAGVAARDRYYFRITAYDVSGNEHVLSRTLYMNVR